MPLTRVSLALTRVNNASGVPHPVTQLVGSPDYLSVGTYFDRFA